MMANKRLYEPAARHSHAMSSFSIEGPAYLWGKRTHSTESGSEKHLDELANVGTSSRNGRLDTLGHFEKQSIKVMLWLQPILLMQLPHVDIHNAQKGSGNYVTM